jgi:hypothetical protein
MVDLLSCDGNVMTSIVSAGDETHEERRERRCPSSVWTRLRVDLIVAGLATETNTMKDHQKSTQWANRTVAGCAVSRYARAASTRVSLYSHLADYYSGSREVGAVGSRTCRSERHVPDMPLHFRSSGRPNVRKLRRLPVCLQRCNRLAELFETVLFNPDWLLAKLKAFGVRGLLEDFSILHPADVDVDRVADAIRKSERSLTNDPFRGLIELRSRLSILYQKSDKIRSLINEINAAEEAAASSGQLSLTSGSSDLWRSSVAA